MCAHGAPDDYHLRPLATTYPVGDMAELAARLGSIVTFDRRGDVVLLDDFADGLGRCYTRTSGTGAAVARDTTRYLSAGYSAKLTGGSTVGRYAQLVYPIAYPSLSKFGWELSFLIDAIINTFYMEMVLYDGTTAYNPYLYYDYAAQKWQYRDGNNQMVDLLTSWDPLLTRPPFHTVKLVTDLDAGAYVRVIIDSESTDLADIDLYSWSDTELPHLVHQVTLSSRSGQNDYCYIDNVIITQDES